MTSIVPNPAPPPAGDGPASGTTAALSQHIVARARANASFRELVATGSHAQVVVMTLPPAGEIGEEVHQDVDQVLVIVEGNGTAVLAGKRHQMAPGDLVLVPAGMRHNVVNDGHDLKLYTVYTSPKHAPDAVHRTKADAEADEGPA